MKSTTLTICNFRCKYLLGQRVTRKPGDPTQAKIPKPQDPGCFVLAPRRLTSLQSVIKEGQRICQNPAWRQEIEIVKESSAVKARITAERAVVL
jgi:hypothetical protein